MRVAIIGVGRMGRRHIHVARKLKLDLVGVVDVCRQSLVETKLEHKLEDEQLFKDAEDLFDKVVPECLIIATTADFHCFLTCKAAERGVKYILVEKPLAVSLEECDRMISACVEFGVKLSVNHQMRFMERYSKPRALLYSEAFGGFKSMTVVGGNFGLSMNGTHYLEAFRYMSDEDPNEVTAWFDPGIVANPRGTRFEDRAGSMRVTTLSGKRLYLESGSEQGHGLSVVYGGRNGLISVNELTGKITTTVRQSEFRELPTTRYGMPADTTYLAIASEDVIDSTALVLSALLQGDNHVTAAHGAMAVKVLVAAYASAENGSRPVQLDSHLARQRVFPWA